MSRQHRLLPVVLLMALLLAACGPAAAPPASVTSGDVRATETPGDEISLEGSKWELASLYDKSPVPGSSPTLAFYPDRYMEGDVGCNSYGANYSLNGQKFHVAEIHRTTSECAEPPGIMQQESSFFEALSAVAGYRVSGDHLEFQDATGDTILIYSRKLPPAVDPALQDTEWILARLHGGEPMEDSHIQLNLDSEGFDGYAGCNRYGGEYKEASEGVLGFGMFAITSMDCPSPEGIIEQEQTYVEALGQASAYRLAGDRLEIKDADGETILVFSRQEVRDMDPAGLMDTVWRLVSMDGEAPAEGSTLTLAFHDGHQAGGHAGCRDYYTLYEAEGGNLGFSFIAMLGPDCPDQELMEQEGNYTTVFGWTIHYRLSEGKLELLTVRGESLAFEPLPEGSQLDLEGPVWKLLAFVEPNPMAEEAEISHMPSGVLPGTEITAAFAEGALSGSAGCNNYGSSYAHDGASLTFEAVYATEMACLDPEGVMEQEAHYLELLRDVRAYQIYGSQLWLEIGDGRALIFRD